jgi:hypothetical protein
MTSDDAVDQMTDEQFGEQVFAVVGREFSLGGSERFIRLHRSVPGDYTAERHTWQADLTVADIARDLRRH